MVLMCWWEGGGGEGGEGGRGGGQVGFLTSPLGTLRGILLLDFLSIDLQDELFYLWRQGEAGDFSPGSVDPVHSFLHSDGCGGHSLCFGP